MSPFPLPKNYGKILVTGGASSQNYLEGLNAEKDTHFDISQGV